MEHISYIADLVSVTIALLFVAALALPVSRLIKLPFTVMLVVIGIVINGLSAGGPHWLLKIADYQISPDVILFVFLPTLVFESAYSLEARQLKDNIWPVLLLAIPGLLISTLIIGVIMYLFADISFPAALLLGAILSATDPVAVISIFKQLGAPKRLTILVEGESLFNDATALVLAKILLVVVTAGYFTAEQAMDGFISFFVVFFGGVIVGVVMAWIAGWILGLIESDPFLEVSLTTILAYSCFLVAEHLLHVSGVMAVVAAGVTMGSWGRTKISPSVAGFLHHFWEFLAYIANALIFLLVGLRMEMGSLAANLDLLAILVGAMLISRAVVVFALVPTLEKLPNSNPINLRYQSVMFWGGLRGAIALAIVLSLPHFEFVNLFTILVTGSVLFTLIVQGLTIEGLVRKLGLDVPPLSDRLAKNEGIVNAKRLALSRVPELQSGGLFSPRIAGSLSRVYQAQLDQLIDETSRLKQKELNVDQERRLLFLRCFAAESTLYYQMFSRGHLSERAYRDLIHSLQLQSESMRYHGRLLDYTLHAPVSKSLSGILITVADNVLGFTGLPERWRTARTARDYEEAWGRYQGSELIRKDFDSITHVESSENALAQDILGYYQKWNAEAKKIIDITAEQFPEFVGAMQERLAKRLMIAAEREAIEKELHAGTIPSGVAESMIEGFNYQIRSLRGASASELRIDPHELLRKVPFFQNIMHEDVERIIAMLKSRTIPSGEVIIREDDTGKSMFLIARGVVRVVKGSGESEIDLASLLPGDFFGEMALLRDEPRTATCRAVTPCALYELSREDVNKIAEIAPTIKQALHDAYVERARTTESASRET